MFPISFCFLSKLNNATTKIFLLLLLLLMLFRGNRMVMFRMFFFSFLVCIIRFISVLHSFNKGH